MIVFDLDCDKGHVFEAWFKDAATYGEQRAAEHVSCPVCGSVAISKGVQSPNIATGVSRDPRTKRAERQAMMMGALRELRAQVEKSCDYVGPDFAEEARKIHHGEVAARGIYGEATPKEAEALREEGISVAQIPWLDREDA